MIERDPYNDLNPELINAMFKAKGPITQIDAGLRALVELRVSQINGCVYCVDLHSAEARSAGETQQRLDALVVWREARCFDPREKAAFAWAEAVTLIADHGAPQDLYDALGDHFSPREIVDLTAVIAQMNAWNRLAVSFGHTPD